MLILITTSVYLRIIVSQLGDTAINWITFKGRKRMGLSLNNLIMRKP